MLEHPAEIPEQFDDRAQEKDAAELGMWIFLATEVLFFGVLFAGYVVSRFNNPKAFEEASRHTDVVLGTVETAVLLTSSLTMAMAVRAIKQDRSRYTTLLLISTMILGCGFVGIHLYEYYQEYHHQRVPGLHFEYSGPLADGVAIFYWLYFVMTGFHMLHVTLGVLVIGAVAWFCWRRKISAQYVIPLELTGLYWHFVDIVWVYLFPLFYLVART